jgi:starch synthase
MVAPEVAPWAKTGGLADVLEGLPPALERLGHSTLVVLPRYRGVELPPGTEAIPRTVKLGSATLQVITHVARISERRRVAFVDHPASFDRAGLYGEGGSEYKDNDERFALLSVAALDVGESDAGGPFDILHAHEWQSGLAPALLATEPARWPTLSRAGRVFTIHNFAYQGVFPRESVPALGLPWALYRMDGGEFWGRFSFLKTGINYSDLVTTVSPNYARETKEPEFGCGLEGVLDSRGDRYLGILNGIDTGVWDPASDRWLPAKYGPDNMAGKRACKRALLERFRLPVGDDAMNRPLIGLVSRLVNQKGLDLIAAARKQLVDLDATWVFLGTGDPVHEEMLRTLAAEHPTRVGVFIGFDESLAHLIEAGSDMFLMPSRFEPCGLNQLYSLRYGTVPIVRAVGGLDDTVQSYTSRARKATGFKFSEATPDALVRTVRQAVRLFEDRDAWTRLQRQGMAEDHAWTTSAREYVKVYRRARVDAAARQGQIESSLTID